MYPTRKDREKMRGDFASAQSRICLSYQPQPAVVAAQRLAKAYTAVGDSHDFEMRKCTQNRHHPKNMKREHFLEKVLPLQNFYSSRSFDAQIQQKGNCREGKEKREGDDVSAACGLQRGAGGGDEGCSHQIEIADAEI